jgi:hypothetical protein
VVRNDAPFGVPAAGGGGLSRLVARPAYQRGAGVPRGRRRAVPDIAFYADAVPGYTFYWAGNAAQGGTPWFATGGTSISAPLLAGAVALIGKRARRARRGRVGLLNPTLYALARRARRARRPVFRDVIRGTNDLLGTGCCRARRQFDLATGWGSLDLRAFSTRLLHSRPAHPDGGRVRLGSRVETSTGALASLGAGGEVPVARSPRRVGYRDAIESRTPAGWLSRH